MLNAYSNEGSDYVKLSDTQYQDLVDDVANAAAKRTSDQLFERLEQSSF